MPVELSGARVLLTGATGGIGNAIARALHERGAHVVVTGRRQEQLDELASELGDRVKPVTADLASRDGVRSLADRASGVDVFVSNAALPGSGALDSFSPDEIDRAIDVNLHAPMQLTRELAPGMRDRGRGHIVLVSSISGKVSTGYGTVYAATKFGLRGFGLGMNDELHGTGVGVTVVSPGFIRDTGMFAESGAELPRGVRTRTAEDVANAVVNAIEKGRPEIDVAPFTFRLSGRLYGLAPGTFAAMQRALGARKVTQAMAKGQADKR
jgi:short-subunit dehydrogenase